MYEFKLKSGRVDRLSLKTIHEGGELVDMSCEYPQSSLPTHETQNRGLIRTTANPGEESWALALENIITAAYTRVPGGRNVPVFFTHYERGFALADMARKHLPDRSKLHDNWSLDLAAAATYQHQSSVICDFKWTFEGGSTPKLHP